MVEGLNKFKEFFKDFNDNYILIGGAACDALISDAGLNFRTTKDIDIVLVVEVISPEFVKRFWQFISEGNYCLKEKSSGGKKYYRFTKPETRDFPFQLELFSRKPDIELEGETNLTPIPIDADISSLSAILLNEDYYEFTLKNSQYSDGLHLASACTLICLKIRAYIDLKKRKEDGGGIDSKDIKKHRLDVVRLAAILTDQEVINIPTSITEDLRFFIKDLESDMPNGKTIAKGLNLGGSLNMQIFVEQLKKTFHLQ